MTRRGRTRWLMPWRWVPAARIHARIGGLSADDVKGEDGLR